MTHRILFCFLMMLAFSFTLGWFYFEGHVIDTAPRAPDVRHTVAVEEHGAMVYLTPFQDQARWSCVLAALVSAMAAEWVRRRCNFTFREDELRNGP
jgi:hypothetical protein